LFGLTPNPNIKMYVWHVRPVHPVKVQTASKGRVPLILNLCIRRRWAVSVMPRSLYTWWKTPVSI